MSLTVQMTVTEALLTPLLRTLIRVHLVRTGRHCGCPFSGVKHHFAAGARVRLGERPAIRVNRAYATADTMIPASASTY